MANQKLLHNFSIDEKHCVLVYKTSSPSNYNRFVVVVLKNKKSEYLSGTTSKETDKKGYKELGKGLLKLYKKDFA